MRLSKHGGVPGRIRRHRRIVLAQFLVQEFQRFPGLSTKATTFTKLASFSQRTRRALTRRAEIRFAIKAQYRSGVRPDLNRESDYAECPPLGPKPCALVELGLKVKAK